MKRKVIACILAAAMALTGVNQSPISVSAEETGGKTGSETYNYAEFTEDKVLYDFAIGTQLTADSAYSKEAGYGFSKVAFPNEAAGWDGGGSGKGVYHPREAVVTTGDTSLVEAADGALAVKSKVWTEKESTGYGVYTYEETATLDIDLDSADYEIKVAFKNPTSEAYTAYVAAEDIARGYAYTTDTAGIKVPTTNVAVAANETKEITVNACVYDGQLNLKFLGASSAAKKDDAVEQTVYVSKVTVTRKATEAAGTKPTIWLVSDSTVQSYADKYAPQTGWGETLCEYFGAENYKTIAKDAPNSVRPESKIYETDKVIIENRALGGRSSSSFIMEGLLDDVMEDVKPGDYLFVQFGHNDATAVRPNRYVAPADFGKWIQIYVDGARQRGVTPVLVTPVARYSYNTDGTFKSDFAAYGDVMKQISEAQNIPLIDLTSRSIAVCNKYGVEGSKNLFLHVAAGQYTGQYANGAADNTHLQVLGARQFAKCVAQGIEESTSAELKTLQDQLKFPVDKIASVEEISVRIAVGTGTTDVAAALPTMAAVTYESGAKDYLSVTWSDINVDTSKEGTGSAVYKVEGDENARTATIEVVSARKMALVSEWAFDFGPASESDTVPAQVNATVTMPSEYGMTLSAPQLGLGTDLYDSKDDGKGNHYGFTGETASGFTASGGAYFRDYVYGKGGNTYTFKADVRAGYYYVYVYTGCKEAANTTSFYFNDGAASISGPIALSNADSKSVTTENVIDGRTVYTQTSSSGSQNKYCVYQIEVPEKTEGSEEGVFSITLFDNTAGLSEDAVTARLNGIELVRYIPVPKEEDPTDDEEKLASTNTRSVDTSVISNFEKLKDRALVAVNLAGKKGAETLVSATDADGKEYTSGAYLSWRSFEGDFDKDNKVTTTFDVYCNGKVIASKLSVTNLIYPKGKSGDVYKVVGSNDKALGIKSVDTKIWENQYLEMSLYVPADETMPNGGGTCTYTSNDMSVGDVDGDGVLELIVKWYPSNAKDSASGGFTGKTFIDTYKVDYATGEVKLMTRIDMGVNIRSGAHYTQFQVWDYDGDGAAEIAIKTADGTTTYKSKDGTDQTLTMVDYVGACSAEDLPIETISSSNDYREPSGAANFIGRILSGPEYFSIFNLDDGTKTAQEAAYIPAAGNVTGDKNVWGDTYGNRADRYLSGTAYLDGKKPYAVFCRGYYARTTLTAYYLEKNDSVDAEYEKYEYTIKTKWTFDTDNDGSQYKGQGYHSLSINDVDNDGRDEIVYGSLVIDHNGKALYSTKLGHGDALHVSNWVTWNDGLEIMGVHEDGAAAYKVEVHDAATGKFLMAYYGAKQDNGRGAAADIDPTVEGAEFWSLVNAEKIYDNPAHGESNRYKPAWDDTEFGGVYATSTGFIVTEASATSGSVPTTGTITKLADGNPAANFTLFWDGDLLSEIQDHDFNEPDGYRPLGVEIYKWDYENNKQVPLLSSTEIFSNNGTKGNMGLVADFLGDWREEIIARNAADNKKVRIYMSTIQTDYVVPCLLTNLAYREGIAWQNVAYNQPANLSYLLSEGVVTAQPAAGTVDKSVSILFTAANDGKYGHKIEGYEVYRAESGGEFMKIATIGVDSLTVHSNDNGVVTYSYEDHRAKASTTYEYKIAAVVDGKTSYLSNALRVETTESTTPEQPEPGSAVTPKDGDTKAKYTVNGNNSVTYDGTAATGDVTIPATVTDVYGDTYNVTTINASAFEGSKGKNIKKVTIGDNVTTIGKNAFAKSNVTEVVLGKKVKTIGVSAFENAAKLKKVTVKSTVLATIDKNAFKGCKILTTVTLPDSVTKINEGAFQSCTKLAKIQIGKTTKAKLTTIGKNAFSGDKALKDITITSKKLKTVGNNAFKSIKNGAKITVAKGCLKTYNNKKKFFAKKQGITAKMKVKVVENKKLK